MFEIENEALEENFGFLYIAVSPALLLNEVVYTSMSRDYLRS